MTVYPDNDSRVSQSDILIKEAYKHPSGGVRLSIRGLDFSNCDSVYICVNNGGNRKEYIYSTTGVMVGNLLYYIQKMYGIDIANTLRRELADKVSMKDRLNLLAVKMYGEDYYICPLRKLNAGEIERVLKHSGIPKEVMFVNDFGELFGLGSKLF